MFWPMASPPGAFAQRRDKLMRLYPKPALFASGLARVRNMQSSYFPFRAESHFLYLVGQQLEAALLFLNEGKATLYVTPFEASDVLWMGEQPSLTQLETLCGLEVRPMDALVLPEDYVATLPPQDADTADWLSTTLDRPIEEGSGDELGEEDRALADAMIELRLSHDEAALNQLRQASQVTDLAHRAGMQATHRATREAAVRAAMEAEITAHGMSCAYGSIVTVHGEVLHNERHDGKLHPGDLLLCDVGAETPEGWAGDVTRTWPVSGKFSQTQRVLYELVLSAQKAAIETVVPGASYRKVHRVAAKTMLEGLVALGIMKGNADELYAVGAGGIFFPHGVGHLLGLDVHDLDDLGDRATYAPGRQRSTALGERYLRLDRDLAPNMVVTVEPGFYQVPTILNDPTLHPAITAALNKAELQKFADVRGIRIEDDVLVTESGREVLTATIPKTVSEIEAAI